MKTRSKNRRGMRKGAALLIAMIFMVVFATIAVGMMTMSTANAQVAFNQHEGNGALICAESGADVLRHWMGEVTIDSMVAEDARFGFMALGLQANLSLNNISNISMVYDGDSIVIDSVALDDSGERSFSAVLKPDATDSKFVHMKITGVNGSIERTLSLRYSFGTRYDSIFDYGVATKGPLHLSGNIDLTGYKLAVEASVYIESNSENEVLSIIGNSMIAGEVSTTNPDGVITLQGGQAGIGGETGSDALDHFSNGVAPTSFPTPNPDYFEGYVPIGNVIDSTTDISNDATYTNVRIAANTNPNFTADTTLLGVIFIESPNQVSFTGGVSIQGIIVGDGDVNDNSGVNTIDFGGNVSSVSVAGKLDDDGNVEVEPLSTETFGDLHEKTGTFIMAPGFAVSMGGNFDTVNGAIAANGVEFYGNAGGEIVGSVLNYSDEPMTFSGNADLTFNRSGTVEIPAGFEPESVINYRPEYYSEGI